MKKLLLLVVLATAAYFAYEQQGPAVGSGVSTTPAAAPGTDDVSRADDSESWRSGQQVRGSGTVTRVLPDDNDGSRHQRFILRLASGRTLLIAHNIDLAPRVEDIVPGDEIDFRGQYEWNDRGGVLHWTHADPAGQRPGGWLRHRGRVYR